MSAFGQLLAVSSIGLRALPQRSGASLTVVVGVAVVVAVLMTMLAIATGFTRAATSTGAADRAIILNRGATTESAGNISREAVATLLDAAQVRHDASGKPVASAEALAFIPVANPETRLNAFVTIRGVSPEAKVLRPEIHIAQGRAFMRGARELIVGVAAQRRLPNLSIGSSLSLPDGDWKVVGTFQSGGDSHESELLADAATLMSAYRRNWFNSVTVALARGADPDALGASLDKSRLTLQVQREDVYFAEQAGGVSRLLKLIAYGLGGIMAFGAAFGALNTMYTSVNSRAREISTLRAIGFTGPAVVTSALLEALVLSMGGALLGVTVTLLLFQGSSISTLTGVTPSQLTFLIDISPSIVVLGAGFACAIGMVGGIFAGARAVRVPLSTATRARG
jgi:putative ABC transport system permease protein